VITGTDINATASWSRQRLLTGLVVVAGVVLVLVGGLGYAAYLAIGSTVSPASARSSAHAYAAGVSDPDSHLPARGAARRADIAKAPMLKVTPAAMRPTVPAAKAAPVIEVPLADRGGAASVPTGFPHTPAGAVGQLAEIETTVLGAMSIELANQVYAAWAMPGGVGVTDWELTKDVQVFLGGAQMGAEKDAAATVSVEPAGALVKGTDGPDWTLACVLMKVRATIETDVAIGYGYCAPMQWVTGGGFGEGAGRWMIAPGHAAAKAPSTWPGSQRGLDAGWRTWAWAADRPGDPS